MNKVIECLLCAVIATALWGCSGSQEKVPEYYTSTYENKIVPVQLKDGDGYVMVNTDGKQVGKKYARLGEYHDGLAVFAIEKENDSIPEASTLLYGFLDQNGEEVIKAQYADVTDFSEGFAWVCKEDSTPVSIDRSGKTVTRLPEAWQVMVYLNGYAAATSPETYYLVDKNGGMVTFPKTVNSMAGFPGTYMLGKTDGKYKMYELKDNSISAVPELEKYDFAYVLNYEKDLFVVISGENYGIINNKGEYVVNPQYKKISTLTKCFMVETEKEKWGTLDKNGKELVPAKYKELYTERFDGNYLIASTTGNRFQVLDMKGETLIPAKYEKIKYLTGTLFAVKKDDKWGIYDVAAGEVCCQPQFKGIGATGQVMFAKAGEGYAVINREGKMLSGEEFAEPVARVYENISTKYYSPKSAADFIGILIEELPGDKNIEGVAEDWHLAKKDFNTFSTEVSLRYMTLSEQMSIAIAAELNQPALTGGYWSSRTSWNAGCYPKEYIMYIDTESPKYAETVRNELKNKYRVGYAEGITEGDFTDCSAIEVRSNPKSGNKTMRPYIFDY